MRHDHVQCGAGVLQPELRDLRPARPILLQGSLLRAVVALVTHDKAQPSAALSVMVVPASAFETGHDFFVSSAMAWNFVASRPGTTAVVLSSIFVIEKPGPSLSRW